METASDSWFADFDNDGIENIAIGRLPVANNAEALAVLDKLARYDAQAPRAEVSDVLVSDAGFEGINNTLQNGLPQNVVSSRIDRTNLSDSQMRVAIQSSLNGGPMVVTYTGHGSTGVWTNGGVFNVNDALNLNNSELSFFMLMTCLNGYAHNAYNDSLAEALIRSQNGAVGVWASSASTFVEDQFPMAEDATRLIFTTHPGMRIGDITVAAKQMTYSQDVRRSWHLIGDPTVVIK
jgi:hypothetical protein